MDKIYVNEMSFYGYHGVFEEETKLGQRFFVDITLELDLRQAGRTDDLNHTINYQEIYDFTREIVEGPPKKLVEAVGEAIANGLLERYAQIVQCCIKVTKPDPPIPGYFRSVAVEINRGRE